MAPTRVPTSSIPAYLNRQELERRGLPGQAGALQGHGRPYCAEVVLCSGNDQAQGPLSRRSGPTIVHTSPSAFRPQLRRRVPRSEAGGRNVDDGRRCHAGSQQGGPRLRAQGYTPIQLSADGTVGISWLTIPQFNGNVDAQPDVPFFVHNAATDPCTRRSRSTTPNSSRIPPSGRSWSRTGRRHPPSRRDQCRQAGVNPNVRRGDRRHVRPPPGHHAWGLTPPLHFHKGKITRTPASTTWGSRREVHRAQGHSTATCSKTVTT